MVVVPRDLDKHRTGLGGTGRSFGALALDRSAGRHSRLVPATSELFVPQMLNYELVGGVSFKKGCYPGQEVVARSQYLGKLKRRMFLGSSGRPGAGTGQRRAARGRRRPLRAGGDGRAGTPGRRGPAVRVRRRRARGRPAGGGSAGCWRRCPTRSRPERFGALRRAQPACTAAGRARARKPALQVVQYAARGRGSCETSRGAAGYQRAQQPDGAPSAKRRRHPDRRSGRRRNQQQRGHVQRCACACALVPRTRCRDKDRRKSGDARADRPGTRAPATDRSRAARHRSRCPAQGRGEAREQCGERALRRAGPCREGRRREEQPPRGHSTAVYERGGQRRAHALAHDQRRARQLGRERAMSSAACSSIWSGRAITPRRPALCPCPMWSCPRTHHPRALNQRASSS